MYLNDSTEITLEKDERLPMKKIKQLFKPLYKKVKYKVRIGKIDIKDQLAAEKYDFSGLKPETLEANIYFNAWLLKRLIKKCDEYFDLSEKQLIKLMCKETFEELTIVYENANPSKKKTELTELVEKQ